MKRKHLFVLVMSSLSAAASGLAFGPTADAALAKTGDAQVKFIAKGPGGMNIEGKGSSMWTVDDGKKLKVVVQLTALSTGIALRDKHMREKFLETPKYPDAVLVVNRADLKFPTASAIANTEASGILDVHGVSKGTRFTYSAVKEGELYKVTGKVRLNLKDHDIAEPSYLGVKVQNDIDVWVQFSVKE